MAGPEKMIREEENKEIERRFLVTAIPADLDSYRRYTIRQGYEKFQDEADDGMELRIRQKGERFFETKKRGLGEIRDEFEIEISREEFEERWPNTKGRVVEKTRYEIPTEKGLIELDILLGKLEGLVVAEIEFADRTKSRDFTPFDWMGREITEDLRYTHQNLILHGLPEEITNPSN